MEYRVPQTPCTSKHDASYFHWQAVTWQGDATCTIFPEVYEIK